MSWTWINNLHSANWNQASGICLFAYVLGCVTAGYYLVRLLAEEDIREIGSGSVGARNVSRVLGKTGFFLTLLFDFGKGSLAVVIARHFTTNEYLVALAMIVVVMGHIWPAQLRFHGGKGMATSLGALLVYDPELAITFGFLFLGLFIVFRRTVLPGLAAMACLPLAAMMLGRDSTQVVLISVLSGLVLIGHRKNLMEEIAHFVARRNLDPKPEQTEL
jgi:glycerol-3-phosphate acyltransferase PlsY